MKTVSFLIALLALAATPLHAAIFRMVKSGEILVTNTTDLVEITACGVRSIEIKVPGETTTLKLVSSIAGSPSSNGSPTPIASVEMKGSIITGAEWIKPDAGGGWCVVKITSANDSAPATPANVAVIPEDATGQFQVILESSVDMVTWSPVNPGTYGGNTASRFFRTRIVRQ